MFLFHERNKWKCLFLFHDWFPLKFVFRYSIYLSYLLELIKRRPTVQEKNMSCEWGLNFDQWKTFFEKSKRVWFGLFTNLPIIIVTHDFSQSSFKLRRGVLPLLQNTYPNLKTTRRIKLKFFLLTKLLENLPLKNISYLSLRL